MVHAAKFLGVCALVALATCGGLDEFSITESAQTTIQGSALGGVLGNFAFAGFSSLDISENQTLENQGVKRNQIDSVKVREITMTITDTSRGQNFDFLDSIEFYVEAEGLDRKLLASGSNFASGLTTIGLDVRDVELAAYVSKEAMSITTDTTGNPPAEDTTIEAEMTLDVNVNVSGAICGD